MAYAGALQATKSAGWQRETTLSDAELARILGEALRAHTPPCPKAVPSWSNSLQGNLAEFLIWDVGDRHWRYFAKVMTDAANAKSPWKASSDPGIDIIAVRDGATVEVFLIEIKSSVNDGTGLILGEDSCLQTDFRHMYAGAVQPRIINRVGALLSDLVLRGEADLADKVNKCIGESPSQCNNVWLHPTLVCSDKSRHPARHAKMEELRNWLVNEGWQPDHIVMHVVEADCLKSVLEKVLQDVCKP